MLQPDDILHIAFLSTLDIIAMFLNAVYIFIIRRKTPKHLSSYSCLLLNIACVDFLASICSLMCTYSLHSVSGCIVLAYLGPCTLINVQFCHLALAIHTNLVGQSVALLFVTFAYRLWGLETSDKKMEKRQLWTSVQIALIIFGVVNTTIFYLGASYDVPEFPLKYPYSAIALSGGITDNLLPRSSLFSLIHNSHNQRSSERHDHQMIYRSLIVQMMLPAAYIPALSLWLLDLMGIVHSRTLQRSILVASSGFALASPLINMYYIPPYRKYLKAALITRGQVRQSPTLDFEVPHTTRF